MLRAAGIAPHDALIALVLRVSSIACMLPWVRALALDPVVLAGDRAQIASARVAVEPAREAVPGYRHMAIHPYPVELEGTITLRDGTVLALRPVRPEDAEIERAFVAGLSEETRYYRFFYRLHELTPAMIGRFTQVDYDRELALLALTDDAQSPGGQSIVGIARYIANPDHCDRGVRDRRHRRLAAARRRVAAHEGAHRVRNAQGPALAAGRGPPLEP